MGIIPSLRLPRWTGKDVRIVNSIDSFLSRALYIPPPCLLRDVNRLNEADQLGNELRRRWLASAQSAAPTSNPPSTTPPTLNRNKQSYVDSLLSWDGDDTRALGDALLKTPPDARGLGCMDQWCDLLTTDTNVLERSAAVDGPVRLTIRLAFPSRLTCLAVTSHLLQYKPRLERPAPSQIELQQSSTPEQNWYKSALRTRILPSTIAISDFRPSYVSTRISGWKQGPDHLPLLDGPHNAFNEPYGNTTLLNAFLQAVAPNCHSTQPAWDGTSLRIDFTHEPRHRCQLFNLNGRTSPSHGITQPLKLHYSERKKAATQACGICGIPGHVSFHCTSAPTVSSSDSKEEIKGDMDTSEEVSNPHTRPCTLASDSPYPRDSVCRDCYSWYHPTGACCTPPDDQYCKVCEEKGHTSWYCKLYRPTWVTLHPPPSVHPPNPRPMAILAQQRGVPFSWSSVAGGGSRSSPLQYPAGSVLPLPIQADFPPLNPNASQPSLPPPGPAAGFSPPPLHQPPPGPSTQSAPPYIQQLITSFESRLTAQEDRHLAALQQLGVSQQQSLQALQQSFHMAIQQQQQQIQQLLLILSKSTSLPGVPFPQQPLMQSYPASNQPSPPSSYPPRDFSAGMMPPTGSAPPTHYQPSTGSPPSFPYLQPTVNWMVNDNTTPGPALGATDSRLLPSPSSSSQQPTAPHGMNE